MLDKAVIVCVDYSDFLAVTLPYNRHHFGDVHIVTSMSDEQTIDVAGDYNAHLWRTDLFYADGADFNKWRALEWALDSIGRDGWLCLMDADVLWPKSIQYDFEPGKLYSPMRRMFKDLAKPIPQESEWTRYPIHRDVNEWAGYSQIFHGSDHHLPAPPWHETNWKHAGGADSFFQFQWEPASKVRPPFEVLHLGEDGANWCGRVTPRLDGTMPDDSTERQRKLKGYFTGRRQHPDQTKRFDHEKLS